MTGAGTPRQIVEKVATKLKFPQAFGVFVALFLLDLLIPDLIPFADEILLGLAAALFGMWREPEASASRPAAPLGTKPPEKNVTPRE
ncbi:MAG: hypothetical protein IPJ17_17210 [Holophagales bacterium]|nr:MAG: hypothetical protein IPJ17_17210 [Holophagales bacterium]